MPTLSVDRTRLLLGFQARPGARSVITARLRDNLKALGLYVEGTAPGESLAAVHHTSRHLWVRGLKGRTIRTESISRIPEALGSALRWVAPAERHGTELLAAFQDAVVVRPRPNADPDLVTRVLGTFGLREWTEKSRYLGRWRYFVIENPLLSSAGDIAAAVLQAHGALVEHVNLEYMSHAPACTLDPNDLFYERQWAPPRVGAPAAWDVASGAGVIIAVIDSGCELDHPDLGFLNRGLNLEDMISEAHPVGLTAVDRAHGTLSTGIIAARLNNVTGVAGLAGNCQVLPLAADSFTHAVVAAGIRLAMAQGARVINMSFQTPEFSFLTSPARDAIEEAAAAGIVLCASSGNRNDPTLILPARHPDVMACGGSDESDHRWLSEPRLGSGYGDGMFLGRPVGVSVVAPCLNIFSTDLIGAAGVNPGASPYGDYGHFNATSAAAAHVSGLAALVMSGYPSLTGAAVRRIIESTAEKVGGYAYADVAGYASGTRHIEMGYGRLHAFRSVDLGDVMIADWPGDDGVEPSTPPDGVYWATSDLVVRPSDDGVFDPADPDASSLLRRGRDHTVYARVRNLGPAAARNVHVEVRVTPWIGLEFVYPIDWLSDDMLHLRPTPVDADFATVAPGGPPPIARFTLTAAQVEIAAGWGDAMRWHPCLLGVVTADNDHAFASAAGGPALQMPRNNLAQRNLSVAGPETRSVEWPFVVGHPADPERIIEVVIDAGRVARDGRVQLFLDGNEQAFPALSRAQALAGGKIVLQKVLGGKASTSGRRRTITMTGPRMIVRLALSRAGRYPLRLAIRRPRIAGPGDRFRISVAQRSLTRGVVGGASLVL